MIACELYVEPQDEAEVVSFGFGICRQHLADVEALFEQERIVILEGRQTVLPCMFCAALEPQQ